MAQKHFNLDDEDVALLRQIANERNCTQTEVVKKAIRALGNSRNANCDEATTSSVTDIALETLVKQLKVKDQQIDCLSKSLLASQSLHAAEKQEQYKLETHEVKKTKWQKIKEALKN